MDKIFERFYAAADAILTACVGDFDSSNVESGDDLSPLANIRVIAHDMDDNSILIFMTCVLINNYLHQIVIISHKIRFDINLSVTRFLLLKQQRKFAEQGLI